MVFQIKVRSNSKLKVTVPPRRIRASNIDTSNAEDGYVLMYKEELQNYTFVHPDEVLIKSVQDNFLPSDFLEKLDRDLDDRIDLDAGQF